MSLRNDIADFCTHLTFDALPKEVVQFTKLSLMDEICLMIAGRRTYSDDYPDIAQFMKDIGGKEESTIVPLGWKVPCLNAALVNTSYGISTSFDAVHGNPVLHLPAALYPALIAVAESQKAGGKELILATVIGAEIMTRVALSLGRHLAYARAFHRTSVCAPFACAAGAGKLLGLGKDELANAFSLAAVQAAGSQVWAGPIYPTSWSFQVSRAAQSGVMAAMLAKIGFSGADEIFENERGFLRAYSEKPDPPKLTEELGNRYDIMGLPFKRFNVGIYVISSIETLIEMLQEHEITVDAIEEVTVRYATAVMPLIGIPEYPGNRACTHISARYILAVTAHLGADVEYNLDASGPAYRQDPGVVTLFKKINISGDPELDKVFPQKKSCILTIKRKDGKVFSRRNDGPSKGDPEKPMLRADIEKKFNKMTLPILGREKADKLKEMIDDLENINDISRLVGLMSA
jgi:2-methylcitrate dehydratase PrpD